MPGHTADVISFPEHRMVRRDTEADWSEAVMDALRRYGPRNPSRGFAERWVAHCLTYQDFARKESPDALPFRWLMENFTLRERARKPEPNGAA